MSEKEDNVLHDDFICPICKSILTHDVTGKSLVCRQSHNFDISSKGYVNLLINTKNKKLLHGDDKEMVAARREFLNSGYYKPLADCICECVLNSVSKIKKRDVIICDAGCGEGYYTNLLDNALLEKQIPHKIYGLDISRDALVYAAKRNDSVSYAVSSVFRIPLSANFCDLLLTIFSPFSQQEYKRVLRDNGIMIMVFPLENHLFSLKEAVYNTPYKNAPTDYGIDGFNLINTHELKYTIKLDSNEKILNLFSMTPYYHKTAQKDKDKLLSINSLETQIEFCVAVYQNK